MSEEKGVFEFGLQFHMDGLKISQDVKDSEVAGEIHRLLSERFKSFDVIVDLRELARAQLAKWYGERIDELTIKVLTGRSWII